MSSKRPKRAIRSLIRTEVYNYLQKHKDSMSLRAMAAKFKETNKIGGAYSISTLIRYFKEISSGYYKMPELSSTVIEAENDPPIPESMQQAVARDMSTMFESARNKDLKRKYAHVINELRISESRYDALLSIKDNHGGGEIHRIDPVRSTIINEAVPVIMLSDWHIEETVLPETINGLNEYNVSIAKIRWTKCIQNSLRLIKLFRHSSDIDQIVVWLGGDFITGYIHEELEESNGLSPTEAVLQAKRMIKSALDFYKTYGDFKKITVVCNYGNHGRTQKKFKVSTSYKNSYEWMMYKDLEDYYQNDSLFNFIIPNGFYAYVDIVGTMCRFWHGDDIRFAGGVGGLTIPLNKAITGLNKGISADYNFIGHWHQCWEATRDCFVNGSGIGLNAYALRIKASPEQPMQGFKLIDAKLGPTAKLNILCT